MVAALHRDKLVGDVGGIECIFEDDTLLERHNHISCAMKNQKRWQTGVQMRDGVGLMHDLSGGIDGLVAEISAHPTVSGAMFLNGRR